MKASLDNLSYETLSSIKQGIYQSFSLGELKSLCFELGIEFEDLAGSTKNEKSQELVLYFYRRRELHKLLLHLVNIRPRRNWAEITGTSIYTVNVINSEILVELREILEKLYTDEMSIRRVVHDSDMDASNIPFDSTTRNIWFNVLAEAIKLGRVNQLLDTVEREYSNNEKLQEACAIYRQSVGLSYL